MKELQAGAIGTVCTWCGRVIPHHKPGCLAMRGGAPLAGDVDNRAPEAMTRATLEAEVKRLHMLARDVKWLARASDADLRHKLAELDHEQSHAARADLSSADVVRALLVYAIGGYR